MVVKQIFYIIKSNITNYSCALKTINNWEKLKITIPLFNTYRQNYP